MVSNLSRANGLVHPMRTFSRDHWESAQDAWRDGEFSAEWKPYRHEAAMRGILYPPEGTKWDSWDEDPSQRAMLIRAIRETPAMLHEAIARSRSWSDVIDYILRRRDEWRAELNRSATVTEATPGEAVRRLGEILSTIRDSM